MRRKPIVCLLGLAYLSGLVLFDHDRACIAQASSPSSDQSHRIHGLLFVGRDVILVSEVSGRLLRSDDYGKTWQTVSHLEKVITDVEPPRRLKALPYFDDMTVGQDDTIWGLFATARDLKLRNPKLRIDWSGPPRRFVMGVSHDRGRTFTIIMTPTAELEFVNEPGKGPVLFDHDAGRFYSVQNGTAVEAFQFDAIVKASLSLRHANALIVGDEVFVSALHQDSNTHTSITTVWKSSDMGASWTRELFEDCSGYLVRGGAESVWLVTPDRTLYRDAKQASWREVSRLGSPLKDAIAASHRNLYLSDAIPISISPGGKKELLPEIPKGGGFLLHIDPRGDLWFAGPDLFRLDLAKGRWILVRKGE